MALDDSPDLLPGLAPAAFRGVAFHMPDTSSEAGRRVAEHLFPGLDQAAYDDMGKAPEVISVSGILLGDDYIAQAKRLKAAFETPGPARLMHPWWGALTVIMEEPGSIRFSAGELRVARFDATFKRFSASGAQGPGSATGLRLASQGLQVLARDLLNVSLSAVVAVETARALARTVRLVNRHMPRDFPPLAAPAPASSSSFTGEVDRWLSSQAMDAITADAPVIVGRAADAPVQRPAMSPRVLVDGLLSLATALAGEVATAPSPSDRVLLGGIASLCLAHGGHTALHVTHESRPAAHGLRQRFSASCEAATEALEAIDHPRFRDGGRRALMAIDGLQQAVAADINEAIGRLPRLHVLELTRETDAFLVAHHVFGDDPSRVEEGYRSIIARNRPRHPSALPAGPVEVEK